MGIVLPPELVVGVRATDPPRSMLVEAQLDALNVGCPLPRATMPMRTVPLPVMLRFPVNPVQLFCRSMRADVVFTLQFSVPPPLTAPFKRTRLGVTRLPT